MDAIVIAGGIPKPEDPLYEYTQGENKALLEICEKSMIQWVLDALEGAQKVERLVIIGLPEHSDMGGGKIAAYLPTQGDLLENVKAGAIKVLEINPDAQKVLVVSSDIPTITPEMVDWCVDTADQTEHEVYYNVITRQVMEARFPESNRSYVRLKDMAVCGGDMNVIHTGLITENNELWARVVAARKNAFKQALLVGIDNLILLLLRAIDLEGAVQRVSKRLNIKGIAIQCPYAEIGMDVDKPHQLQIVRADLEQNLNA